MPIGLVLHSEGAEWSLPSSELPSSLPADSDRRGIFQLRPTYDYLTARVGDTYVKVRRTSFQATPADTMTVEAPLTQSLRTCRDRQTWIRRSIG